MKPLDFGGEGVTGSVNADGRLIALNFYHPTHGYVTLTSAPPFPEAERYRPATVRAYRAALVRQEGFGVRFEAPLLEYTAALRSSAIPESVLRFAAGSTLITTFACAQGALQMINASANLPRHWGGRFMLQRCAYTQLTEGGPLPMLPLKMNVLVQDHYLIFHNPQLGAAVAVAGLAAGGERRVTEGDQPIDVSCELPDTENLVLAYGVGLTIEAALANARWLLDNAHLDDAEAHWQALVRPLPDDPLVRRGLVYTLMTAVPVEDGTCLLTDHMLLPLSWNRDAYYAARALLSANQMEVVRCHLLWTFETAERQNGAWARCYLANGRIKDSAYQLDQQLYPLLELAEYLLAAGDETTASRLLPQVEVVLTALETRRAPDALLYPTDETPADDPVMLPYHLSSHILMWYTLGKLNAIGAAGKWAARMPELRETIQRMFVAERSGSALYAYTTDGKGKYHFYHDANDFPLALAPAWGFLAADDAVWRRTVEFAFSDANHGGFYDGHLGSVHSPAPWALGDVQEWIIARTLGDAERAEQAWIALHQAAQIDGALPEAYNAADGSVFSRHWFTWPNAALACMQLGAFDS